jgi:hypothetical protein
VYAAVPLVAAELEEVLPFPLACGWLLLALEEAVVLAEFVELVVPEMRFCKS